MLTDNSWKTRRPRTCAAREYGGPHPSTSVAADVCMELDNTGNVDNVEKAAMEVIEVRMEDELDKEELLTAKQSVD